MVCARLANPSISLQQIMSSDMFLISSQFASDFARSSKVCTPELLFYYCYLPYGKPEDNHHMLYYFMHATKASPRFDFQNFFWLDLLNKL